MVAAHQVFIFTVYGLWKNIHMHQLQSGSCFFVCAYIAWVCIWSISCGGWLTCGSAILDSQPADWNFVEHWITQSSNICGNNYFNMGTRIPVPLLSSGKAYNRYRQEIQVWQGVTDLSKSKQAAVVALSLPEDDEFRINIRAKVFDELGDELNKDTGMDKLIEFLDKCLGKDDLSDAFDKYHDFETYRRTTESIPEFLAEFDSKYKKISKLNMTLPPEVLAFKLIMSANIPSDLQMFVKSGMDYSDKTKLYDQAQTAIKKYLTDSMAGAASTPNFESVAVKTEPIFATSQYRGNYQRRRGRGRYPGYPHTTGNVGIRNTTFHDKDFSGNHLYQNSPRSMNFRGQKGLNSPGPDGSPRRCRGCGSYKHFIANCPHESDSSPLYTSDTYTQNEENFTLFTQDTSVLTTEANIHAVLDSACTSTVCGQRWLDNYLTLTGQSDQDVRVGDSAKIFKFGGGERLHSEGVYKIPAEIVGHSVTITTDVVSSDIPLLLGKEAMKKAKVKLDVENDEASIYGQQVSLDCTSSGHYAVSILPESENSTVYMTNLVDMDHNSRVRSLRKLHLQFGHATSIKLRKLLQNANAWDPSFSTELDNIVRHCDTCKRLTRAPPRPVVAFPMANDFNQLVTMDLKIFRKGYILHIIDAFTRFSVSTFVKHKTPSVIIDSVLKKWISVFGTMQGIFSDNGGEFSNEEMREVASVLGVQLHTTAADSPHQNGLCEKFQISNFKTYQKSQTAYLWGTSFAAVALDFVAYSVIHWCRLG